MKRTVLALLVLSLFLSALSMTVYADGESTQIEDSIYIADIQFGLANAGDLGMYPEYNATSGYYEFLYPDTMFKTAAKNINAYITGKNDRNDYVIIPYADGTPAFVNNKYSARLSTTEQKITWFANNIKSKMKNGNGSYEFEFAVVKNTENPHEEVPVEIIKYKCIYQYLLKNLMVSTSGMEVQLSKEFSSYEHSYHVTVPTGSSTVSLLCTPQTALQIGSSDGTQISFKNAVGIAVASTTDTINGDVKATLQLADLPEDEEGRYVIIRVDYSGNTEHAAGEYKIVFDPDGSGYVDPTPEVAAASDTVYTVDRDTVVRLSVSSNDTENKYSYQWYKTTTKAKAEIHEGSVISGATGIEYQPDTSMASEDIGRDNTWYFCRVSNTVEGQEYVSYSPAFHVFVNASNALPPTINTQPSDLSAEVGTTGDSYAFSVYANAQEFQTTLSYTWYTADDVTGSNPRLVTETDGSVDSYFMGFLEPNRNYSTFTPIMGAIGTYYYFCEVTASVPCGDTASVRSSVVKLTVTDISGSEYFNGSGTEEDPWQISSVEDLLHVKHLVETGHGLEGQFLKLTKDLTLPDDWEPIGGLIIFGYYNDNPIYGLDTQNGKNVYPFMGTFDGGGHLITIPKGCGGLFNFVRRANIKNLSLYGENIIGSALVVENFTDYGETGDYNLSETWTANIDNITLKSGSHTTRSGLLAGSGSSSNKITITNCTVEEDVIVGEPGGVRYEGSIVWALNGTIQNCVSYATVYGTGGLVGFKNTSMGACAIVNSAFLGKLESESFAGGIVGTGYGYGEFLNGTNTAPNTVTVTIQNCYVNADITGSTLVGGVFGGEPLLEQCWANGIQNIQDNYFAGTITVKNPNENTHVGAVIGYIRGVNRYNYIANNYYLDSCGAEKGIGLIAHVDTDARDFGIHDGVFYFNTSKDSVEAIKQYIDPDSSYTAVSSRNLNRSDDPAGADADKLTKAVTAAELADGTVVNLLNQSETSFHNWEQGEKYPKLSNDPIPYLLTITGDYQKDYYIGDELSTAGMVFTLTYSDGKTKTVNAGELSFSGFDSSKQGECTVVAAFGAVSASFKVTVLKKNPTDVTVYFTLLGDDLHNSDTDGSVHTLAAGNLQTWITKTAYTLDGNATVLDLIRKALTENGMSIAETEKLGTVYIPSVTRNGTELGEFDNGINSGWLYTINGKDSSLGVAQQFLSDGDEIVFHYTDDYTKEDYSMGWTGTIDNQSASAAKVTVADAKTGTVTVDCTLACAVIGQKADGSYALLPASVSGNTVTFDASAYTKVIVRIKGDITGDGKVDSSDTLLMKQLAAGIKEPDAITALLLDLTGDGKINSSDTLKMKRVAAGLDSLAW